MAQPKSLVAQARAVLIRLYAIAQSPQTQAEKNVAIAIIRKEQPELMASMGVIPTASRDQLIIALENTADVISITWLRKLARQSSSGEELQQKLKHHLERGTLPIKVAAAYYDPAALRAAIMP